MIEDNAILVVDDDQFVRDSLSLFLEAGGFTVVSVENGEQAISALERQMFAVVVCDLAMPRVSGIDVLKYVKCQAASASVIIMSGVGSITDVIDLLRLGAADYFPKPIADLTVLEHAINRCLQQNTLVRENNRYREELEQANKELAANLRTLESDQQAGRQLQMRLLPRSPQAIFDYRFEHKLLPSLYLSGDFVDYFAVGENKIMFFMADVSGHGASSAFVTALLKNFTAHRRSEFFRLGNDTVVSPEAFLTKANDMLLDVDVRKHMTMCFGVIDVPTNTLTYSVAGHLPLPLLVGDGKARFLEGRGMPVGLFKSPEFSVQSVALPDSFTLYFFSDGILEILPPKELADKEALLLDDLAAAPSADVEEICRRLLISSSQDLPDDIAVLTISKG